jgi:hypothetical protein
MTTEQLQPAEVFAVDLAMLAREIAMDIFPLEQIIELHRLSDEEWKKIQDTPKFQEMLGQMVAEWNATSSTRDRIKIKAATGLESQIEVFIRDIGDLSIPLAQRVEAGKFLARLGELDGVGLGAGAGGGFNITLNIGAAPQLHVEARPRTIEGMAIPE